MPVTKVRSRWDTPGLEGYLDFFSKASGASVMTITDGGVVFPNPSGGIDYYVNSNLSASAGNGRSWETGYKTLTEAMAASHTAIASGRAYWAARNRIFYKGDNNTENLTTLAQKTDIIGVGSGGGHRTKATIVGAHAISGTGFVGCRFINMAFMPASATQNIFTLTSTERGIEFHDCFFDGAAPIAGSAIVATANWFLRIENCEFIGQYSDSVIEILAGNAQGLVIKNNYIEGGEVGIELTGSVTGSPSKIIIEGNKIRTAKECIKDSASIAMIVDNMATTAQSSGSAGAGTIVGNVDFSMGNQISASNEENNDWPARSTL